MTSLKHCLTVLDDLHHKTRTCLNVQPKNRRENKKTYFTNSEFNCLTEKRIADNF